MQESEESRHDGRWRSIIRSADDGRSRDGCRADAQARLGELAAVIAHEVKTRWSSGGE